MALPNAASTIATRDDVRAIVTYQAAYQLSLLSPINIIYRRKCFSFSPTKAVIAIRTEGRAVTMNKMQGPRDEVKLSGMRARGKVGNGRRVRLKYVGELVEELKIASSSVRSK